MDEPSDKAVEETTDENEQESSAEEEAQQETHDEDEAQQAETVEVAQAMEPSQNAVDFLQNIDPDDLSLCLFKDELVTLSEDGQAIGEFMTNVQKVTRSGEELLLIHASSHGEVDGSPMGTTITCYARPNDLTLVEQEHSEYVKVRGHELEKKTEMRVDPDSGSLKVSRRVKQGDEIKRTSFSVEADKLSAFVSEGTNILLQRLLIRRGLYEEYVFVTADTDSGQLVQTSYKPLPERQQQVGQKQLRVCGVERNLMSVWDLPYTWQSFFMEDGHLTMRIQVGSPAVVVVQKVPFLIQRAEPEIRPTFGKQPLVWEEDMEMNSRFLHRKEELKAGHDSYLREHPEARALLADFFQFLLLRKPKDVVAFAADYFASFSSVFPDTSAYKHSDTKIRETKPEA